MLCLCLPAALRAEAAARECRTMQATGETFCRDGNRWVLTATAKPASTYKVGDDFPVYDQSMLMDLRRYGLAPVDGPWRYYLRDGTIYKVSALTAKVTEVVGPARSR